MNKICTSIEQSQKLIELGIDVNTADMIYLYNDIMDRYIEPAIIREFKFISNTLPAWSLSALLDIIPKHIKDYNVLRTDIGEKDFSLWYDEVSYGVNDKLPDITMVCPVDACVAMIKKLHELKLL